MEDEVVDPLGVGKLVGLTEPGMVGRDDLEAGRREQPVKGKPPPGPAGRVQEQHRFPGPAAQQVHPPPGKLKELLRGNHVCHRAASSTGRPALRALRPESVDRGGHVKAAAPALCPSCGRQRSSPAALVR